MPEQGCAPQLLHPLPTSFFIIIKQQLKIVFFHGPQWNGLNIDDFLRRLATKLDTLVMHYSPAAIIEEILRFPPEVDKLVLYKVEGG